MNSELYHVGRRVFASRTDVLPPPGCSLVFPIAIPVEGIRSGELATAVVDEAQPPYEFDFSGDDEVVTRLAVRDLARLDPA